MQVQYDCVNPCITHSLVKRSESASAPAAHAGTSHVAEQIRPTDVYHVSEQGPEVSTIGRRVVQRPSGVCDTGVSRSDCVRTWIFRTCWTGGD